MRRLSWMSGLALLVATGVFACCMVPATYTGSIGQDAHEAVVIHDGDREELVLRIRSRITGETLPSHFAWVVTMPNEPDAYAVAAPELFQDMFDLSCRHVQPKPRKNLGFGCAAISDLKVDGVVLSQRVRVGPYDIQPVRGVGENALEGLNTWLAANDFPTEAPEHMAYFVDNDFTFLCIRIAPPENDPSVSASGLLPPLHVSFSSEQPYLPLRFSSRQGAFDVNLHTLTRKKLDFNAGAETLNKINWASDYFKRNVPIKPKDMPDSLKAVYAKSVWEAASGKWYYNNVMGSRVNRGDTIKTWREDVFFALK